MQELKIFEYNGTPITFEFEAGNVMVNATEMSKVFGKEPHDFLKTKQTKSFIEALGRSANLRSDENQIVRVVNGGSRVGTWMHKKLALKFAGWLSADFELWVYDKIEELLEKGQTSIKAPSDDEMIFSAMKVLTARIERKDEELRLANKTIREQAPKVELADKVYNSETCHTTTTIAKELGMSAHTLNHKLKELKVQYHHEGHWVLMSKYQNMDYAQTRTHLYYDSQNVQRTSLYMVWTEKGRAFLHKLLNEKLNHNLMKAS